MDYDTEWPDGAYSCIGCELGASRLNEARDGCEAVGPLNCKPGYWKMTYGPGKNYVAYPCIKCPGGFYRTKDDVSTACLLCSYGYVPNADQSSCVEDTSPRTSPPTPTPTTAPIPYPFVCPAGQFNGGSYNHVSCYSCKNYDTEWPAGAYSCTGCELGVYRLNEARTGCEEVGPLRCKPGYWKMWDGPGSYVAYPCNECPAGTVSYSNSLGCMTCRPGYVPNAGRSECVEDTRTLTSLPSSLPTPLQDT
jgi:hypothetical protein